MLHVLVYMLLELGLRLVRHVTHGAVQGGSFNVDELVSVQGVLAVEGRATLVTGQTDIVGVGLLVTTQTLQILERLPTKPGNMRG